MMRARLLFTIPTEGLPEDTPPPIAPSVLLEDGSIGEFSTDFLPPLPFSALDEINEEELREELHLPYSTFLYLPPAREVPEDMDIYSSAFLYWRQEWWSEVCAEVIQQGLVPCLSAEKVPALAIAP